MDKFMKTFYKLAIIKYTNNHYLLDYYEGRNIYEKNHFV